VNAYRHARRFGYSRRGALRLRLLLALLSRHDPPTDTWGRAESSRGHQPRRRESPTWTVARRMICSFGRAEVRGVGEAWYQGIDLHHRAI